MSGKEKLQHFFRYYKMPVIVVCVILVIGISILGNFTFNKKPDGCLRVGVRAHNLDPNSVTALPEHLAEKFPEMTENGEKVFYAEQFFAGYKDYEAEEAAIVSNRLDAFVAAGMVDVLIGDLNTLQSEVDRGVYMDLREVFNDEELKLIEELAQSRTGSEDKPGIVYVDYKNMGLNGKIDEIIKNIPYLICVSDGDQYVDACVSNKGTYLAIIWNTENIENVKTFIWSLLGESDRS